ncbi:lipid phosphate phosphatase 1 [Thelephora terrestris]|uniref:Lipid phosphate phosphatase 1 n=1 Tax=Thelephora terrestris TaxID=56493 RepID=A0A9P6HDI3_9AGAM|nr:lipid phosphate phosphatase 1 [Thelephora terrestris]
MMDSMKRWFSQESLEWFHRSYVIDWVFVVAFWLTSYLISFIPIYERNIPLNDESIGHRHTHEQISSATNRSISLFIPLAITVVVGLSKRSLIHIHHSWLSALAGSGLTRLVTEFLKNRVGRLRPDFLSRCKWDDKINACAGSLSSIRGGRKSFPSGHSSTAFAGMTFFALYLVSRGAGYTSSKLSRIFIVLLPLFYATWVAISRVEDYRHHVEDVVVGGIIGLVSSAVCFLVYWHNPFSKTSPSPRSVYGEVDEAIERSRHEEYQLTLGSEL